MLASAAKESPAHTPPELSAPHPERLDELPSGTRAIVRQIEGGDMAIHRLMAMGMCVGREIEVVRRGNPLILRMLGARIGVSGRLARLVVVTRS